MTSEDEGAPVGDGHGVVRMLSGGALRALAHPLRIQLYDILTQYGPQTASSLATMTGESSGSTSYHLRALARYDLIREIAGRGTARERWWERPVGGVSFADPAVIKTPSGRSATQIVMTEFLTRRHHQLMDYVATGLMDDDEDWRDSALVTTGAARLTVTQLRNLTERLQAIIDETVDRYRSQDGDDVRPVTIRADVFPLPADRH